MNDLSNYTIKQVEALFAEQKITEEFLTLCRNDGRKAIGTLVRRYERQQQERQRVAELYNYERQFWAKGCEFVAGVRRGRRGAAGRAGIRGCGYFAA